MPETFPTEKVQVANGLVLDFAIIRPSNPKLGLCQDRIVQLSDDNKILDTIELLWCFDADRKTEV